MNAILVQHLVIALVVSVCTVMAIRRLLPGITHRAQVALARALSAPARSRPLRVVGVWLQPHAATIGGCGSGDGCGGCGGCGSTSSKPLPDGAQPLVFRPRKTP